MSSAPNEYDAARAAVEQTTVTTAIATTWRELPVRIRQVALARGNTGLVSVIAQSHRSLQRSAVREVFKQERIDLSFVVPGQQFLALGVEYLPTFVLRVFVEPGCVQIVLVDPVPATVLKQWRVRIAIRRPVVSKHG